MRMISNGLLLTAAWLFAAPAASAQAVQGQAASAQAGPAAPAQPWDSAVRCAALAERMPEVMDTALRHIRATPLDAEGVTPEMKEMMKAGERLLVASRPVIIEMLPLMLQAGRDAVKAGFKPSTTPADAATAEALFEREMAQRRREYASIRLTGDHAQTQLAINRLNAELKTHCEATSAR